MATLIQQAGLPFLEGRWDVLIDGGKIKTIAPRIAWEGEVVEAEGCLLSPSLIDPHIHLDKVNVLDTVRPNESGTLTEAIEILWEKKKSYTEEDILQRSEKVILHAIKNGTFAMRSHVDVDNIGGLKPLEGVLALREKYRQQMTLQLVAFPQEGILKNPGSKELMREAMKRGCDLVGGMPANEQSPKDSLDHVRFCFDLAEEFDADIDMHVDETDDPFYRTLEMVADETIRRGWQGRVTAGHTCALAAYDDHYASYVIDKVRAAGIFMITNPLTNLMLQGRGDKQPIRRGITRVKELLAAGVTMSFGQDCVNDTFYPLGNADMLQVANVTTHAAQMSLPQEIERVYRMITEDAAAIMKFEPYGLHEGAPANLVLLQAKSPREAIAYAPRRLCVWREGRIQYQAKLEEKYFF